MTEPGAIDCDVHPSVPDVAALLPHLETVLAGFRGRARAQLARLQLLSAEIAADLAAGVARQERPAGRRRQDRRRSGVRPLEVRHRDPELPLRRAASVQRGHGGGVLPGAQRLHRQGMARPRSAAAGVDRHSDAEHRIRGRRDRALRQGQALRAGAGAGDAGGAARPAALLADLRGLRTPRPAARHPRRLGLPQSGDRRSAGRPGTSRTTRRRRRASSRRWRA